MRNKPQLIKTDHLILKALEDVDQEAMLSLFYNEEINKTYMIPEFSSKEEAIVLFNKLKERSYSSEYFEYGIYLENCLIGFINECSNDGETIEIGYMIHPNMKNQGYATEVLSIAIQELFRLGFSIIQAGYFEDNGASKRVMEKCNMKKIAKKDSIFYHNKMQNCLFYEIRK